MCKLCDEGRPHDHSLSSGPSRRDFLKVSAATGAAAAGLSLFSDRAAAQEVRSSGVRFTRCIGLADHRDLIRGSRARRGRFRREVRPVAKWRRDGPVDSMDHSRSDITL